MGFVLSFLSTCFRLVFVLDVWAYQFWWILLCCLVWFSLLDLLVLNVGFYCMIVCGWGALVIVVVLGFCGDFTWVALCLNVSSVTLVTRGGFICCLVILGWFTWVLLAYWFWLLVLVVVLCYLFWCYYISLMFLCVVYFVMMGFWCCYVECDCLSLILLLLLGLIIHVCLLLCFKFGGLLFTIVLRSLLVFLICLMRVCVGCFCVLFCFFVLLVLLVALFVELCVLFEFCLIDFRFVRFVFSCGLYFVCFDCFDYFCLWCFVLMRVCSFWFYCLVFCWLFLFDFVWLF